MNANTTHRHDVIIIVGRRAEKVSPERLPLESVAFPDRYDATDKRSEA